VYSREGVTHKFLVGFADISRVTAEESGGLNSRGLVFVRI